MVSNIPSLYPLDSKASLGHVNQKCLLSPSTDEWIKKMWYTYTMEYYSAIKKSEIMPFAATGMDLEIILSQTKKNKYITYMWNL